MGLRDILLRQGLKPRVVHHLPGRLRVQVPLLRNVPERWRVAAECLPVLLRVPEGVDSVDFNPVSGALLLQYDTSSLSEQDMLRWLDTVVEFVLQHQQRFADCCPENIPALAVRLEAALRRALGPRAVLDEEILRCDDVWET